MIKLAADEDLDNYLLRALFRRKPDLDIVRVQDASLTSADDDVILDWAASEDRVLVTHDVQTMTAQAYARIRAGKLVAGVFIVRRNVPMSVVIEDILLLNEASLPGEWQNQVRYIPLR